MKILKTLIILTSLLINVSPILAQEKPATPTNQRATYITGKINNGIPYDTLSLVLHGPFYSYQTKPEQFSPQILRATADQNGEFKFKVITGNSPFHVSLFLSSKRDKKFGILIGKMGYGDIDNHLIEPGDSIHIEFDKSKQYYTGKGADLFEVQNKVEQSDKDQRILKVYDQYSLDKNTTKWLKQKDSLLNAQLSLIATYQRKLSPTAYAIIRADAIAVNRTFVYSMIISSKPFFASGNILGDNLAKLCKELKDRPDYLNQTDRGALSPKYIDFLYKKMEVEVKYDRLINNIDVRLDRNYFQAITKRYSGVLRDKLLAWWLTQLAAMNHPQQDYMENALTVMQTPAFIQMVQQLETTYAKGQPITDFDFKDAAGKTIHLADFKGKVVFIDLWFSGCTGCVAVAKGLPYVEEEFKGRSDVLFVSVSIDRDKQLWLRSIDKNQTNKHYTHFTTATTTYLYTGGTGEDNPFIKKYVPSGAYPQVLLVDKEGRIFSSSPSRPVNPEMQKSLIKEINEAVTGK